MLIVFWALAAVLVPSARWISRITVWSRRSFKERVLIIGAGEVGHTLAAKIAAHPEYRIDLIGFLDDGEPRRNGHGATSSLGDRRARRPGRDRRGAAGRPRHRGVLARPSQRLPARRPRLRRQRRQGEHRAAPVRGRELARAGRRRRGHPAARRRPRRAQPLQHGRQARVRPRRRRPALHPHPAVHGHRSHRHQAGLPRGRCSTARSAWGAAASRS